MNIYKFTSLFFSNKWLKYYKDSTVTHKVSDFTTEELVLVRKFTSIVCK